MEQKQWFDKDDTQLQYKIQIVPSTLNLDGLSNILTMTTDRFFDVT